MKLLAMIILLVQLTFDMFRGKFLYRLILLDLCNN